MTHDEDGEWLRVKYTISTSQVHEKDCARKDEEIIRPILSKVKTGVTPQGRVVKQESLGRIRHYPHNRLPEFVEDWKKSGN